MSEEKLLIAEVTRPDMPGWTKKVSIPESRLEEAKSDLRLLFDPQSLCSGDGYYARSLKEKWGMDVSDLVAIVGRPIYTETWSK